MLKKRKNLILQKKTKEPRTVPEEEKKDDGGREISKKGTSSMDRRMEDLMNNSQTQCNASEFGTGNQNHTVFFSGNRKARFSNRFKRGSGVYLKSLC